MFDQPRQFHHHPGESRASQPRACGCTLDVARRLLTTLLLSLLALSSLTFVAWFALHPHNPAFRLRSFQLTNSSCNLKLTIANPNQKIDIILERIETLLLYGGSVISRAVKEEDVLLSRLNHTEKAMEWELLSDADGDAKKGSVFEEMGGRRKGAVVDFGLKMAVSAKFQAGGWPSFRRSMAVLCGDLKVRFSSSSAAGNLGNGMTDCKVSTL